MFPILPFNDRPGCRPVISLSVRGRVTAACALIALTTASFSTPGWASDELDSLFGSPETNSVPTSEATATTEADNAEQAATSIEPAQDVESITLPEGKPAATAKPPPARGIEEIIVTATKREQSVRDLVGSIDAFTGDALMEKGATGLEEILKFSPGVTIATGSDGESAQISFRGILSESGSTYFGRTFGLFYGDTSMINPTFRGAQPDFDPWDMASVEVLKGPQGTLFGGGALAGAVRFVPQEPEFDEFTVDSSSTYIASAYSNDSGFAQRAAINIPATSSLAFRIAGAYDSRPGYVDDLYREIDDINSQQRTHGRILARWEPTEKLAVKFQVFQREFIMDDGSVADNLERPTTENRRISDVTKGNVRIITADVDYDLGFASLRALFSQVDKNHDYFGDASAALDIQATPVTAYQILDTESSQPSLELRLTSSETSTGGWLLGGWNYIAGLYLVKADQLLEVFIDVSQTSEIDNILTGLPVDESSQRPNTLYSYGHADAVEQALFFDLNRSLTDTLEMDIGARWFKQESEALMYDEGADGEIQRTEATPKDSGISPRLGFIWHFQNNMSLVTSASRGFRYGGVNVLPASSTAPKTFDSDFLWNYELGIRTEWLDNHLQLDLTAFYIDWTDLQIAQLTQPDELFVYVDNVGAARSQGVEFSSKARLPWNLEFQAGASYTDARTSEVFESDSGTVPADTRLPASPYFSGFASLGADYQLWRTALHADINYAEQSSSKSDLHGSLTMPAYNTIGLTLKATWEHWPLAPELRLNVNNLLNETVVAFLRESGEDPETGETIYRSTFIQPRLIMLSLGLHF